MREHPKAKIVNKIIESKDGAEMKNLLRKIVYNGIKEPGQGRLNNYVNEALLQRCYFEALNANNKFNLSEYQDGPFEGKG